jgi:hypothetical protein
MGTVNATVIFKSGNPEVDIFVIVIFLVDTHRSTQSQFIQKLHLRRAIRPFDDLPHHPEITAGLNI